MKDSLNQVQCEGRRIGEVSGGRRVDTVVPPGKRALEQTVPSKWERGAHPRPPFSLLLRPPPSPPTLSVHRPSPGDRPLTFTVLPGIVPPTPPFSAPLIVESPNETFPLHPTLSLPAPSSPSVSSLLLPRESDYLGLDLCVLRTESLWPLVEKDFTRAIIYGPKLPVCQRRQQRVFVGVCPVFICAHRLKVF